MMAKKSSKFSDTVDRIRDWWHDAPKWQHWIVYGLWLLFVLVILPTNYVGAVMTPGTSWLSTLTGTIGPYILLCVGLNVVVGQAGLLDLGYVAFYAVGAYTVAFTGTAYGWSFWGTIVLGMLVAAVSGVILGAPTLRLRGDYLAIVTLGFGEIIRIIANNSDQIDSRMGGASGIANIPSPPTVLGLDFSDSKNTAPFYYLIVALIILAIIFAKRLENSRVGRSWAAIREDEDAAELMGVPTFKFKLLAFAIGALVGGLSGGYYASVITYIEPNSFQFILSATFLAAVILGGSGNIMAMIIGGFLVAWLPEFFRDVPFLPSAVSDKLYDARTMLFAAAMVLLMIFRPEGIWPSSQRKAEMKEGGGGMGALGAEVATPAQETAEVSK